MTIFLAVWAVFGSLLGFLLGFGAARRYDRFVEEDLKTGGSVVPERGAK